MTETGPIHHRATQSSVPYDVTVACDGGAMAAPLWFTHELFLKLRGHRIYFKRFILGKEGSYNVLRHICLISQGSF